MWFIYILKCSDNSLYTGSTNNLEKRLEKHQAGKGAKYTRGRVPVELLYHESYPNQSEALKRESQIKGLSRTQKEDLIKSTVL